MYMVKAFIMSHYYFNALALSVHLIETEIRQISAPFGILGFRPIPLSLSACLCEGSRDINNLNTFLCLFLVFLHFWYKKKNA